MWPFKKKPVLPVLEETQTGKKGKKERKEKTYRELTAGLDRYERKRVLNERKAAMEQILAAVQVYRSYRALTGTRTGFLHACDRGRFGLGTILEDVGDPRKWVFDDAGNCSLDAIFETPYDGPIADDSCSYGTDCADDDNPGFTHPANWRGSDYDFDDSTDTFGGSFDYGGSDGYTDLITGGYDPTGNDGVGIIHE